MPYGLTADTGGHIAYVLEAAAAQASRDDVARVSIVTRLFDDDALGAVHACAVETVMAKVTIDRIATTDRRYLEKADLAADLPAFVEAFHTHLAELDALPDVIHAHFADAAAIAETVRRRFDIPFVYTPHALGIDKRRQGDTSVALDARIALERAAIEAADAVIVSTHDEAEEQVGAYGVGDVRDRVHRIAPGIPRLPADAGIGGEAGERPIVLAIARPVRKKNLAGLLRAYAATPALRDRADLVILAGQHDGRLSAEEMSVLAELKALAADPAIADRVHLPPRHDAADVARLYARAARGGVFVNPAFHEPFGLTLIEAAAAEVPVVATRNGGPAEIVATIGHGLLVDPRDRDAIARACLAMLDDPVRHAAMAAAARANAGRFDWAAYAAATVDVYRSIAAPRRPRLLACDIDGTLTGCPDGARDFAAWAASRRVPFVVATGRSFAAAQDVLARWRLPRPDAFIVDVGTRIMLPDGVGGWRECPAFAAMLDAGWDRDAVERALAPLALEPQPAETAGPHKLSFFGTRDDAARAQRAIAAAGLEAQVIFSHRRLIDVLAPAGGKAAAIGFRAAALGLALSDCVAAGDSGNDLSMLEACGDAIVVANADEDLAVLAPRRRLHRTSRPHAAGVVEALHRLGLAAPNRSAAA